MTYKLITDCSNPPILKGFTFTNNLNANDAVGMLMNNTLVHRTDIPIYPYQTENPYELSKTLTVKTDIFLEAKTLKTINSLISFQAKHKYFFMVLSQTGQKALGQLVSSHKETNFNDRLAQYITLLIQVLSEPLLDSRFINVYQHMVGYFKHVIKDEEKQKSEALIKAFNQQEVSKEALLRYLKALSLTYKIDYISKQSILKLSP